MRDNSGEKNKKGTAVPILKKSRASVSEEKTKNRRGKRRKGGGLRRKNIGKVEATVLTSYLRAWSRSIISLKEEAFGRESRVRKKYKERVKGTRQRESKVKKSRL